MRLFLGIELTDPLRAAVDRVQSLLRDSRADVRWVQPATAHVTLHFLGEVDDDAVARLDAALVPIVAAAPPMSLHLDGVGAFPDELHPRVLWIGCGGDTRPLAHLHGAMGEALRRLGLPVETRPFHPHVTVGRVRSGRNLARLSSALARLRDARAGELPVLGIVLFRSELTPAGAHYAVQSRYRLGAGSSPGG